MAPVWLKAFAGDLRNRGALVCSIAEHTKASVASVITTVFSVLAAAAGFSDRVFPPVADFVSFRLRLLAAIGTCLVIVIGTAWIITAKHQHSDASLSPHYYSYNEIERHIAKTFMSVVLVTSAFLTLRCVHYWEGVNGAFQGYIRGSDGQGIPDVNVEVLNLDRKSLGDPVLTGSAGDFVLSVQKDLGFPAFISMRSPEARCDQTEEFPVTAISALQRYRRESFATADDHVVVILHCTSK